MRRQAGIISDVDPIVELSLKPDVRESVSRVLVRRAEDAVAGSAMRDRFLIDWDDQLKGRVPVLGKRRWPNASELNGTITRESHLELLSLLTQAQRKDPKWTVEAADEGQEDSARAQEAWLTNLCAEYKLNRHLYNLAYNALRDPAAVLYVGWKQIIRKRYGRKFRLSGLSDEEQQAAPLLDEEEREPDQSYEEVPVLSEEVEHAGCDFRVADLADFYLYPPDAPSIEAAIGCAERMLLTEEQLLDGVEDFGYDEAAVKALIAGGPTHDSGDGSDYRSRKNMAEGVDSAAIDQRDGFYECFLWFGRLPYARDEQGELSVPEEYEGQEILAVLCPGRQAVLKLDFSPYPERPYIPFSILPEPNRFLGSGVCELLSQLQEEETATIRYTIDGMNLQMSPVLLAPKTWIREFGKWSVFPGAMLPMDAPGEIAPLQWGQNATMGLELTQQIRGMAQSVIAAKGYGQLDAKQRKNGEMQNVLSATDSKFDLFLSNFQDSMAELGARIVSLEARHMGDQAQTIQAGGRTLEISAQMLRGKFRYIPTATSSTSTPEMRLQLAQAKQGVQMQYLSSLAQAPPTIAPLLWHGARQVLLDMGERQPETWIGPEPSPEQMLMQQLPPQVQALIANGVPPQVAMQMVPSATAQAQQGQQAAQQGRGALLGPGPGQQ